MKKSLNDIDIPKIIQEAQDRLKNETVSAGMSLIVETLLIIIECLLLRFGANSRNSSVPPSRDPNRKKKVRQKSGKKVGGQPGHKGSTLQQIKNPDEVISLKVDPKTLPDDQILKEMTPLRRQVFDIKISRHVIEYQAQRFKDQQGKIYEADFPIGVNSAVQYGTHVRAKVVYQSVYQSTSNERICDEFEHQVGIPISSGTVVNCIFEGADKLKPFEKAAKYALLESPVNCSDETGGKVGKEKIWLHTLSSPLWTLIAPHEKRGTEAMIDFGCLPKYTGTLIHDNWQPYFSFSCTHGLCNAHHQRELVRAFEDDGQQWAKKMSDLLEEMRRATEEAGGSLTFQERTPFEERYDAIFTEGEKECPLPVPQEGKRRRGRVKRGKSRCLLDRLRERKAETLLFMRDPLVPYTNNLAERDIRPFKLKEKVSGCFRSMKGAEAFCLLRSFISTCIKHKVSVYKSLTDLFEGIMPQFVKDVLARMPKDVTPPPPELSTLSATG